MSKSKTGSKIGEIIKGALALVVVIFVGKGQYDKYDKKRKS